MAKRDPLYIDADTTTHLPAYSALELRGPMHAFQAGVIGSGDFKVTAGSGLTVDSAAGRAAVFPTAGAVTFPGLYYAVDDAAENSATFERTGGGTGIPVNASTNPRLDAVVLHVFDTSLDASGRRAWVREYVPGVAAVGAALGGSLPALPTNSLLIAEVLTPGNNPTTIPAANIRDRRPWARGAYNRIVRTSNTTGGNDYTTSTGVFAPLDAPNLSPRIECSGAPLRMTLRGDYAHSLPGGRGTFGLFVDGVRVESWDGALIGPGSSGSVPLAFHVSQTVIPTPGSHVLTPNFAVVDAGIFAAYARLGGTYGGLEFTVEEIARQNAANG